MVGGGGFVFDVFCVTPVFLVPQSLLVGIASIANCCFIFLTEDGLRIIRNVSK